MNESGTVGHHKVINQNYEFLFHYFEYLSDNHNCFHMFLAFISYFGFTIGKNYFSLTVFSLLLSNIYEHILLPNEHYG